MAVDDGSRDGSGEVLRSRARRDPRLRVASTPPRGLVGALRLALAEAHAPIVARLDADDVAPRERLALQAERLERDGSVDVLGDRFVESPLVHPSVAMRTETLRRLGWRAFDGPEDFWLRAFEAGLRFAKLGETVVEWHDSPLRLTRTDPRYAPSRFLSLKLETLRRGLLAGGRAAVVWGAGPVGKAWSRALRAAGHEVRAFVEVDPRKVGGTIHGLPVVALADAAALRGPLHLAAVGQKGARERIRAEAARVGLVEGADFVAVA